MVAPISPRPMIGMVYPPKSLALAATIMPTVDAAATTASADSSTTMFGATARAAGAAIFESKV